MCYENKKVKSPYNWVISFLTQPQVANQQQKKIEFYIKWNMNEMYLCINRNAKPNNNQLIPVLNVDYDYSSLLVGETSQGSGS